MNNEYKIEHFQVTDDSGLTFDLSYGNYNLGPKPCMYLGIDSGDNESITLTLNSLRGLINALEYLEAATKSYK